MMASMVYASSTSRFSSSFWGCALCRSHSSSSSFVKLSSKIAMPGLGHQSLDCRRRMAGALLLLSKKKSGFAELLFNKRLEQQEKLVEESRRQHLKLRQGKVSFRLPVPKHIPRPPYVGSSEAPPFLDQFQIQDAEGIERMRISGKLAARVRDYARTLVKPGVTTDEIDKEVHKMIIDAGAYPSPLGYGGFPKSVRTSVNECICHGIPDSRPLQDGDMINIDVTIYLNGYHGDTSKTFYCGTVDDDAKQLVEVTREALDKAIAICGPGVEFKKIGATINEIADMYRYGVVEHFVGHGVGAVFHSAPSILHNRKGSPPSCRIQPSCAPLELLGRGLIVD